MKQIFSNQASADQLRTKPDVYYRAIERARELAHQAMQIGKKAWALDTAARALRVAETEQERQNAIAKLYRAMSESARPTSE